MAIADTLKEDSIDAVKKLKAMGMEVHMLTGDNKETAAAIGRKTGIEQVTAEVLPHEKAAFIKALQAKGKTVAMVGDGINDSEALAAANVGLAMGSGPVIAMDVAGITLVNAGL